MARLASGFWVGAYLQRLRLADLPVYVTARGDAESGAVLVKLATLDGRARLFHRVTTPEGRRWDILADGPEPEVDAAIARQRGFDPDLWVLEVESRDGRHLLEEDGLAD
ncbi:DUF1491 family protein [Paroceanicella profunda]|uniref:DUF1491 family protein n=1 Tax=Paroceanicella profunda TaxID=2579971 RepID=A0A5B8FH96_9RHOB|nr:DUF1491 family protein [Paroceanicella profunda]QDL92181.1 DUF1491 family protein [Paroceanicella profunda]